MTSPFDKRALGKRAVAPQFPQRRALRRKKGGKIPGFLFGGLFEGTPGSSTTTQSGSSSTSVNNPIYNDLRDTVIGRARQVVDMPYTPYTGEAVAPLTADQNTAFSNLRANQGNYSPFFGQANTSLNKAAALSPTGAGQGYIDQAGGMPTGTQAASPFVRQASQTFPGSVQQYMDPYVNQVNDRVATLGARNLNEKLLPGINDTFTGGDAAQFGRERHADIAGRALRDTQESVLGQQSANLNQAYSTAGNLFNQDANRAAGLAATTGTLAQTDRTGTAGIGTAAGNLAAQGVNSGLATAAAQQGLGQATQAAAGTDANALATAGGIQRDAKQQQDTFDYSQWQAGQNNTVNRLQQAQSLAQGWTLPMTNQYQSTGTTTTTQPQGSLFGQVAGAALGAASLAVPGAGGGASALGNIFGQNGLGWLGKAAGSGTQVRDGGYIGDYAVGGMVPTISMMRKRNAPQQQAPQGPGMMPTGMPGMPPMAPPNPMARQPNGQVASPFADGGPVAFRRGGRTDCGPENDWKVHRGPITARFADGGYSPFLQSSEGLGGRLTEGRPQPFGPGDVVNQDTPTGREAQYRGWGPQDILARIFDSLPPQARTNLLDTRDVVRDTMPDRSIASALDASGRGMNEMMQGEPTEAALNGSEMLASLFSTMAPGSGKFAQQLARRAAMMRGVR